MHATRVGSVRVAKNRLAKIALEGKPCESIADLLTGMTVLTYSEDPVAAAKVAEDYAKENKKFEILGGAMGENALDRAGVDSRVENAVARGAYRYHRGHASAHLLRTSPAQLAHLQAISQASCPPSKRRRKLRKRLALTDLRGANAPTLEHMTVKRKELIQWLI